MDPSVGRFTTRDTIGIWGDPSNLGNSYTYVGNNPQTFVDPFGLEDILLYYPPGVVNEDFAKAYGEASRRMAGNFLEGAKDSGVAIVTSPYTIPASLVQGARNVYGDPGSIKRGWSAYQKWWEDPIGDYFRNNPEPEDVIDDIAYMSGGGAVDFITGRYLLKFLTKCPVDDVVKAGAKETSEEIVRRIAKQEVAKGDDHLVNFMSEKEMDRYLSNPSMGSRFRGSAIHRATDEALGKNYPGRFIYHPSSGPDYFDTLTGEFVEMTTEKQYNYHWGKPGYGDEIGYAFYE